MRKKSRLLVIDSDEKVRETLNTSMFTLVFDVFTIDSPDIEEAEFKKIRPDVIITDINFPNGCDGMEFCKSVRHVSSVPIIILSETKDTFSIVLALEIGADDYMVKPFDPKELLARIRVAIRHSKADNKHEFAENAFAPERRTPGVLEYPGLMIDLEKYVVELDGKAVKMPPKELELLYFLASSPNKVFTRDELLEHVWGYEFFGSSRTVDVHIKRLRDKFSGRAQGWSIFTVHGKGYKFQTDSKAEK